MNIFVFLADGFEEIEALAPIDIFRRAGIKTTSVSISDTKVVKGAHDILVVADILFQEADFSGDQLLFLPGGMPGTTHLNAHQGLKDLLTVQAHKAGKIAAICAAPSVLGELGLLQDIEVICYPGFESQLNGAIISSKEIVFSDSIFTAKAAGVAIPFALKMVELIKGEDVAKKLSASIYF